MKLKYLILLPISLEAAETYSNTFLFNNLLPRAVTESNLDWVNSLFTRLDLDKVDRPFDMTQEAFINYIYKKLRDLERVALAKSNVKIVQKLNFESDKFSEKHRCDFNQPAPENRLLNAILYLSSIIKQDITSQRTEEALQIINYEKRRHSEYSPHSYYKWIKEALDRYDRLNLEP
ncbi:hypothetical protein A3F66_04885 [candidate division TM6 bacterium RIFCSPHIGHO2_12_FULL_32_22]|nr:MAG: hypothetical protein A3F66_04885 [candidate division TM6 bacterium RIFCSPHIGHO2_12_FULL_32_22]